MKPNVSPTLRNSVSALVERADMIKPGILSMDVPSEMDTLLPDVFHFVQQLRALRKIGQPQYAAILTEEGPNGGESPVLLQVPSLNNIEASYLRMVDVLQKANLALRVVPDFEAKEIFVERMSEFATVSLAFGSASTKATVVNSNRKGDTVLYSKGYFLSTRNAMGVSTPAKGNLSAGRYSFGIQEPGGTVKFDTIVWNCPTTVQLNLP